MVERLMGSTYERFVSRVSAGRSMEWNRVTAVAEGRVWSGHDGLEHGLIDRIGGLRAAIARARERAAVGDEVPIVEWPRERSVLETIAQTFGGTSTAAARRDAMGAFLALPSPLRRAFTMAETFQHEHVLVAMPFVLDIH